MRLPTTVPASRGSSPAYSKLRPFRGSRAKSTPPPKVILKPCARSSWPITVPNSQAESTSQLDVAPKLDGMAGEYLPFAPPPRDHTPHLTRPSVALPRPLL